MNTYGLWMFGLLARYIMSATEQVPRVFGTRAKHRGPRSHAFAREGEVKVAGRAPQLQQNTLHLGNLGCVAVVGFQVFQATRDE